MFLSKKYTERPAFCDRRLEDENIPVCAKLQRTKCLQVQHICGHQYLLILRVQIRGQPQLAGGIIVSNQEGSTANFLWKGRRGQSVLSAYLILTTLILTREFVSALEMKPQTEQIFLFCSVLKNVASISLTSIFMNCVKSGP